jgi:hypothetical protein
MSLPDGGFLKQCPMHVWLNIVTALQCVLDVYREMEKNNEYPGSTRRWTNWKRPELFSRVVSRWQEVTRIEFYPLSVEMVCDVFEAHRKSLETNKGGIVDWAPKLIRTITKTSIR